MAGSQAFQLFFQTKGHIAGLVRIIFSHRTAKGEADPFQSRLYPDCREDVFGNLCFLAFIFGRRGRDCNIMNALGAYLRGRGGIMGKENRDSLVKRKKQSNISVSYHTRFITPVS